MPGEEAMVMDLIFGRWRSQTLFAGVKLGIFDALGEKPKGASAVAQELGLEATLCYRLLRALGCLELLIEDKIGLSPCPQRASFYEAIIRKPCVV